MNSSMIHARTRRGFTTVEVAVAIIVIGAISAFAVPRVLAAFERSKAAEAFNYLAAVKVAQERFQVRQGIYATDLSKLDVQWRKPKYFDVGTPAPGPKGIENGWSLTLTRSGLAVGYGGYRVSFNQQGFDPQSSDIPSKINPMIQ